MSMGHFGARLKSLRETRGLSQEALAKVFGFENRQTLQQIESGKRKLTAQELLTAVGYFQVALEDFANPFLLDGDARFSWRRSEVASDDLKAFEKKAGEWIGAYRELSRKDGDSPPAIINTLRLTHRSSFEEAMQAGESVAKQLNLGDCPSSKLAEVMEDALGILVLFVDMIPGVSGAACTLPELNAAVVNRHEPEVRRNFDLAHELFHLLTWDTMPPEWIDGEATGDKRKRVERIEQLANQFAAGLLMPRHVLEALGEPEGDLASWINKAAAKLGVSSAALRWQLVNTGRGDDRLRSIPDEAFRTGRAREVGSTPPPFSRRYVGRIARSIERGHISARRAAALMGMTLDELGELCETFGIIRPAELQLGIRVAS